MLRRCVIVSFAFDKRNSLVIAMPTIQITMNDANSSRCLTRNFVTHKTIDTIISACVKSACCEQIWYVDTCLYYVLIR